MLSLSCYLALYLLRRGCFYGPGCSLPAIPMMGNTFESIKKDSMFEKNKKLLGKFVESDDIEGYLSWLNKGIDFNGESKEIEPYKKAFNFTKGQYTTTEPINIFTTNYDIFNELALEKAQIPYDNGFTGYINRKFSPYSFNLRIVDEENRYKDKWAPIRRYVRLYKIHGSIDWICRDEKIYQVEIEDAPSIKSAENVIIYPTLTKHLDTQQTPYSELFRELNIKLQKKNTTLIVIGYGFPDTHINNMISQELHNSDFNLIVFSDMKEENPKKFYESNGGNNNFHFIGGDFEKEKENDKKNKIHYFNNIVNLLLVNSQLKGE